MKRARYSGGPGPRSILVVLPTWVGDFVMATPTLRAIRNRFPKAHITFLLEPNLVDLVRGGDWMNECVEWPMRRPRSSRGKARWLRPSSAPSAGLQPARSPFHKEYRDLAWDLRRRRFEWAVLLPNSFRSALVVWIAGAKRRIGYDRDGRGFLLTDRLAVRNRRRRGTGRAKPGRVDCVAKEDPPDGRTGVPMPPEPNACVRVGNELPVSPGPFAPLPLVDYYADLAEAIECERPGDRLELFTTPDCDESVENRLASLGIADHRPLVVVSPGARYGAAKCWLPERFATVADRLVEFEDAAVIVTCGPGEEPIARRIGAAMRCRGGVLDAPRLTLGEMKSLVRRGDLLICNDAGPRHFAKAFDVPVVTVFGPTHPEWTATSYRAERIVRVDVDCGPCQQRVCPLGHLDCITGVSVEMVLGACRELLEARVAHTAR